MLSRLPAFTPLANLPTPIQPLLKWQEKTAGVNWWIKRDDLTANAASGNKIRKLEYVAHAALARDADVLITCGGLQSNHARTTALVAAQLGLKSHLVLRGEMPAQWNGNFLLDKIAGATISFITPEEYAAANWQIMHTVAESYAAKGIKAIVIPEGASDALGTFGYAKAVEEIIQQSQAMGVSFDAVFCATGSGGTQAGLILGKALYGWNATVYGINICDDEAYFQQKIRTILDGVRADYLPEFAAARQDIRLLDGHIGDGYAKTRPEELATLIAFARLEGIILDPVYSGKALHGLMKEFNKGRFAGLANILFLHTGGLFGLFPFEAQFQTVC